MALLDVQNLYGKTLEIQNLFQQSIGQAEMALRQAEKNLAAERARRESQVEEGVESAAGEALSLDVGRRLPPERQRRYRLAWKGGNGPSVELELPVQESRSRLDLNA